MGLDDLLEDSPALQTSVKSRAAEYAAAKRQGDRACRRAVANGQYPYLPALEEFFPGGSSDVGVPIGIMEIALSQVVGTKTRGRQEAFACNFMPILADESEFALKWITLLGAQETEGIRDAVKVYEYLWKFYVLEGNKRVSVLKYLKMPMILADITRVMPKNEDEELVKAYYEFDQFFRCAPLYEIVFTKEGSYQRLAELLNQDLKTKWDEDLVKELSYAFSVFTNAYNAKYGGKQKLTPSEAFLVYLSYYCKEEPLTAGKDLVEKRIEKLRTEFEIQSSENPLQIQETPNLKEGGTMLSNLIMPKLYSEKKPLKAAFLYETSPDESSWFYGHELGRNRLQQVFEGVVETEAVSHCLEEDAIREAIDKSVEGGAELIFTTSPTQIEETMRAAVHFPNVRFMNCSINLSHGKVRTYYGRMHEAKFLMGVLAGSLTENHKIGYVADYPIFGAVSRINAFAIGAAMADPEAEVYVTWTSLKDTDWKEELTSKGARMISGPDLIKPSAKSRDYGLYRIDGEDQVHNLAMPVWDWGKYYELIVRSILNGSYDKEDAPKAGTALNYWWGMASGVIDVILSQNLSYYSQKMIDIYRRALINKTFHPFDGELRSRDGVMHAADAGELTNEEMITMNWLNDNVIGEVPPAEKLTDAGKNAVRISGLDLSNVQTTEN
ncbi:MAG: BMP family ABC transporter substrate-binding protein [Lachnospiraceae bacterium]|nr:BMP family ABC transporter substrate-binding protein [Lachnospiraceae bacterium]